ncbi:hypothetical protein NT05HA_0692 [Aggregatibacter aphrophilus NJ8700]|nr:hypothetical protein NT05HA_0692 [Aggregatibacter aphrophilus NJ8700]
MLAQASSLVPLVYLLSTSVDACAIGAIYVYKMRYFYRIL